MTALAFFHIDAALSALGFALLLYGGISSRGDIASTQPSDTLMGLTLGAFALAAVCTLILYGGWIIA